MSISLSVYQFISLSVYQFNQFCIEWTPIKSPQQHQMYILLGSWTNIININTLFTVLIIIISLILDVMRHSMCHRSVLIAILLKYCFVLFFSIVSLHFYLLQTMFAVCLSVTWLFKFQKTKIVWKPCWQSYLQTSN